MKFSQLLEQLTVPVLATAIQGDPEITGAMAVDQAQGGQLSYISGERFAAAIDTTQASALLLPNHPKLQQRADDRQIAWASVADPRLGFAQMINQFYRPWRPAPGVHPTAVIDPSAILGENLAIGPHVVIYPGVRIGDGCAIAANVVIYPEAQIGAGTLLHANCTIHERAIIGKHCVIHSGAAIGAEGFGFVPTPQGWYKMEQSGHVILEDGVEVGCNSAIDRPAVGVTRIGTQTKLDNLVHVAHGCDVGPYSALAGQVGLAGGVKVGKGVLLAGQVGISNEVEVGDGAMVSAQSGLLHDVAPGEVVSGTPAMPHATYLKASAIHRRLPEIHRIIKQLQRYAEELTGKPLRPLE